MTMTRTEDVENSGLVQATSVPPDGLSRSPEKGAGSVDACSDEIVGLVRKHAKEIFRGNCAFADDDLMLLAGMAKKAVDAGLTDDLHESIRRKIGSAPKAWSKSGVEKLLDGQPGPIPDNPFDPRPLPTPTPLSGDRELVSESAEKSLNQPSPPLSVEPKGETPAAYQWRHTDPTSGNPVWVEREYWNGHRSTEQRAPYTDRAITTPTPELVERVAKESRAILSGNDWDEDEALEDIRRKPLYSRRLAITAAIEAEREACAKVAEEYGEGICPSKAGSQIHERAALRIAAAIRSRKNGGADV